MKATLFIFLIILSCASCAIDNYESPQVTVSGRTIDFQTNEPVESGGINAGTVIKFYEGDSNQPVIYNTMPDGSFVNSKVFPGTYSYVAEGPFKMEATETQSLVVDKSVQLDIRVIPNVRLKATVVEVNGTSATVNVQYEKVATDQKLVHLGVVWSKYRNPNNFTFTGGAIIQENVEALDLGSGVKSFTIDDLQPGTKYYVRASARTANPGNYYNYSSQIELAAN
jgi:hypothetical protein